MRKKIDDKTKASIAIEAIRGEKTVNEIASKFSIHPNIVSKYKQQLLTNAASVFSHNENEVIKNFEKEQEELYRHIGEQKVKIDWLKKKCTQWGLI